MLLLDRVQPLARDLVVAHPVVLAAQHAVKRYRRVRDDVPRDTVGIARRDGFVEAPRLERRVALLDDPRPRLVALDHVRPGRGQRMEGRVRCGRVGRHGSH